MVSVLLESIENGRKSLCLGSQTRSVAHFDETCPSALVSHELDLLAVRMRTQFRTGKDTSYTFKTALIEAIEYQEMFPRVSSN